MTLKPVLTFVRNLVRPYFTHAALQVPAWYTIVTHDLTKVESAAFAAGALALSSALKKINAWLA